MHLIDFVLPSFAAGGAERVLLSFTAGLDRTRFSPRVIVLDPAGPLEKSASELPLVERLSGGRLRHALPQVISAIRKRRPTVIFSSQAHLNLALLACKPLFAGAKLIVREANMPSSCLAHGHWPRWYKVAYGPLLRRADIVIATSARMRDEFTDMFNIDTRRIRIILNPVDIDAIRAKAAAPERPAGDGRRFVSVGRLVRQKGFDKLIRWFAECPEQDKLVILGEGAERPTLEALVETLGLNGRVRLPGHSSNPWSFMAGADAVLMSSRWEGMPNVALEALAVGTPVIATEESGGIGDLRDRAPDSVTVAGSDAEFVDALLQQPVRKQQGLGDCLLPGEYRLSKSSAQFQDVLAELCEARP